MIKMVSGRFAYAETITIIFDGKLIKRKVHYSTLDGLYVIIDGEKISEKCLCKGNKQKTGEA